MEKPEPLTATFTVPVAARLEALMTGMAGLPVPKLKFNVLVPPELAPRVPSASEEQFIVVALAKATCNPALLLTTMDPPVWLVGAKASVPPLTMVGPL